MDEETSRWSMGSIIASVVMVGVAVLCIDYAVAAARPYLFAGKEAPKPLAVRLWDAMWGSETPPAPVAEVFASSIAASPVAAPVPPANPGQRKVLPVGAGQVYEVVSVNGREQSSGFKSVRIQAGDLPKLDLAAIARQSRYQKESVQSAVARVTEIYGQLNVPGSPGYAEGLTAVQLMTYLAVAGEFHGECWFQRAACQAMLARQEGCRDILVLAVAGAFQLASRNFAHGYEQTEYLNEVLGLQSSAYPPEIKLTVALKALPSLSTFVDNQADWGMKPDDPRHYITYFLDAGVDQIAALVKQGASRDTIHYYAYDLLNQTTIKGWRPGAAQGIENLSPQSFAGGKREVYQKKVDAALGQGALADEVREMLKVQSLIDLAWAARGVGFADTVTPQGARVFQDRLEEAGQIILEDEKRYPQNALFPRQMMEVGLGLGMSTWRMNEWFNKAIALEPDFLSAYYGKMWFIQPRWYGSPREVYEFGLDCLQSGKWDEGIPLVLIYGFDALADLSPDFYQNPKIKGMVNDTYRQYLSRYPESAATRTKYLLFAFKLKDWSIVKEQLAALGNFWDMTSLDRIQYVNIAEEAARH